MWLDEDSNRDLLNHSLDAIDELRDKAHLRTALYQPCQMLQQLPTLRLGLSLSTEQLRPILSPWPFIKWGMNIVGKLPTAPDQRMYMLPVTDYFTKWVEVEAYH